MAGGARGSWYRPRARARGPQITLEADVTIGGTTFPKGTALNTGLDVVPGSYLPLGLKVKLQGGRLVVGITCALCHATLDPHTMQVVEGGMNSDFNGGLVLTLATTLQEDLS